MRPAAGSTTVRRAGSVLAGSILEMDQALRNLVEITGCPLGEALETMTTTPAKLLGMEGERGRIAPGYVADMVLLSPDFRVQTTIVSGEVAYSSPSDPYWGQTPLEIGVRHSSR